MPSIDELLAFLAGRPAPVQPGVPLCRCGREPAIDGDGAPVGRACVYRGAAIADRPWTFSEPELAAAWSGRTDVLRLERPPSARPTSAGSAAPTRSGSMTRRYAEGTDVPVERSRGEITGILATHGVTRMGWMGAPEGDELLFELEGHQFRFRIERPTAKSLWEQWKADGKSATALKFLPNDNQVAAEWRRRWRANVLLLKAKLEFAEGEASTVLRELLPYAVLTDGRTLEEAIVAGDSKVPLLAARAS